MAEIVPGIVDVEKRDHVLHISIDRQKKMNAFTPEMFIDLAEALTRLDESADLWVGVISFAGKHTTAGLDLPLFRDSMRSGAAATGDDRVDVFGLHRRCRKPLAEIAANAPIATQAIKASALEYLHNGEAAAVAMIPEIRQRTANSADAAEGLSSFIERRDPVFQGK